ncbi:MAG: hypothetical protein ACRD34_02140 [Bryobacteraceae bacterium]
MAEGRFSWLVVAGAAGAIVAGKILNADFGSIFQGRAAAENLNE